MIRPGSSSCVPARFFFTEANLMSYADWKLRKRKIADPKQNAGVKQQLEELFHEEEHTVCGSSREQGNSDK